MVPGVPFEVEMRSSRPLLLAANTHTHSKTHTHARRKSCIPQVFNSDVYEWNMLYRSFITFFFVDKKCVFPQPCVLLITQC